jgi:hypothetical protein
MAGFGVGREPPEGDTARSAAGAGREPSVAELRALSQHATQRVALYRRKMYTGRGDPRRLAELERVAAGAVGRLKRAEGRAG